MILVFEVLAFLLEQGLLLLNSRNKRRDIDPAVAGFYDESKYAESMAYQAERTKFEMVRASFVLALTLPILLYGGLGWLDGVLAAVIPSATIRALAFFGILGLALDIASLPFQLYSTFVIEARFGFNKTKPLTFVGDKLKSYLLGAVLGGLLITGLISLIGVLGSWFWIVFSAAAMAFSVLMVMFYTSLIVPLFNKLTPLPEGELRDAINVFAVKTKFPLTGIYVINGSKRSTKSNAYFSGLGPKKKIVLYDTLIEKHGIDELVAILAHEVGHYKKGHIAKSLALQAVQIFAMMWLFSLFVFSPGLSVALGSSGYALHLNLVAFALLFTPISLVLGLFLNWLSRKHEYEADAFAVEHTSAAAMGTALKRLSVDNLSNLYPHPAYAAFYYSHPPLLQRLAALSRPS